MKQINIKTHQYIGIGLLWLLISLVSSQHTIAQRHFGTLEAYNEFIRDSIINNSDYIFEGIVLEDSKEEPSIKGYYGDEEIKICSAVKINITKILRGHQDLKLGTAELIRESGTIYDYSNDNKKSIDSWGTSLRMGISKDKTQLFFCKKNELPVKEGVFKEKFHNKLRLSLYYDARNGGLIYENSAKNNTYWMRKIFKSINQLYRYLKKYDNIDIRKPEDKSFIERRAFKKQQKDSIALQKEKGKLRNEAALKKQKEWEQFIVDSILIPKEKDLHKKNRGFTNIVNVLKRKF
ncbi:hypothetical protein [Aquimarina agarivorans]|uniref:hypothetical protein n=1 Tax=Aquimarina agarivorans TaxID=980584 RepID=UPI000248EBE6|nr:hypothetical protein [Aquimarina agarivorans]